MFDHVDSTAECRLPRLENLKVFVQERMTAALVV